MPFKPVTIPAKPATDKLDLDQVAFNNFSFTKQYIGVDQPFVIRYTATLFNAEQASAADDVTKIITHAKPQGEHRGAFASTPQEVLGALMVIQNWLQTVAERAGVLEPAE
jgi:hypothetical protein